MLKYTCSRLFFNNKTIYTVIVLTSSIHHAISSQYISTTKSYTPMKLVIATKNQHKVREILQVLSPAGVDSILTLNDYPDIPDIPETGSSFEENAAIKAETVSQYTGLPSLADDSGLVVDALDGEPGIYSARYGGEGLNDTERFMLLLEKMKEVPRPERAARFVCAMVLSFPDGESYTRTGICEGRIAIAPGGEHGFGYDPVFYLDKYNKTMAQLPPAEKNRISHRAHALKGIATVLESLYESRD